MGKMYPVKVTPIVETMIGAVEVGVGEIVAEGEGAEDEVTTEEEGLIEEVRTALVEMVIHMPIQTWVNRRLQQLKATASMLLQITVSRPVRLTRATALTLIPRLSTYQCSHLLIQRIHFPRHTCILTTLLNTLHSTASLILNNISNHSISTKIHTFKESLIRAIFPNNPSLLACNTRSSKHRPHLTHPQPSRQALTSTPTFFASKLNCRPNLGITTKGKLPYQLNRISSTSSVRQLTAMPELQGVCPKIRLGGCKRISIC